MKKIYAFFFSCLLFVPIITKAQDSTQLLRSLTIIGGLEGPAMHLLDNDRSSYRAGIDIQFRENIYLGLSAGIASYKKQDNYYNYSSDGSFFKMGFKYDFLKRQQANSNHITFAGIRFAHASFKHHANSIKFRYDFFGDNTYNTPEESMNAFWMEIGGGIRVELFSNIMIGWNLYGAIMLSDPEHIIMPPYRVPGFGKAESGFVLNVEYNLAYIIPL